MAASKSSGFIKTTFLIISDTHGLSFPSPLLPPKHVDVVIHCGDLTQHSKLDEFQTTAQLLNDIDADLKLMIAGNHDFSLDSKALQAKLAEARRLSEIDADLVTREYGEDGAALRLLRDGQSDNIIFLDEGNHSFRLKNSAFLKVYSSPYTPNSGGDWGFQYHDKHDFAIEPGTDVVITHGPPRGIMDMTPEKSRIGCPDLFASVAKAQPKLHCFGHVHNGWGAKFVAWREKISDAPSHFSDIDNSKSRVIGSLSKIKASGETLKAIHGTSHCAQDDDPLGPGRTLFVNASNKGDDDMLSQPPWLVTLDLDGPPFTAAASEAKSTEKTEPIAALKRRREVEDSDDTKHRKKNF